MITRLFITLLIYQLSSSLFALDERSWTNYFADDHRLLAERSLAERKSMLVAHFGRTVPPMGALHNKTMAAVYKLLFKILYTNKDCNITIIGPGHGYEAADVMLALIDLEARFNQQIPVNILVLEPNVNGFDILERVNQFVEQSGYAYGRFDRRLEVITGHFPRSLHSRAKADLIICNNVLQLLDENDIVSTLQAMSDHLNPEGYLSISVPASPGFFEDSEEGCSRLLKTLNERLNCEVEEFRKYYASQVKNEAGFPGSCHQVYLTKSENFLQCTDHPRGGELIAHGYCLASGFTGSTKPILLPPRCLYLNDMWQLCCIDYHAHIERVVFIQRDEMQKLVHDVGLEIVDSGFLRSTGQGFELQIYEPISDDSEALKSFVIARKPAVKSSS